MTEQQVIPEDRSRRALGEYHARLRRWRVGYAAVLVALVVIAGVLVKLAYAHGEISHATLSTAPRPAPSVALRPASTTLHEAWSSPDHTAIGAPYWNGTMITYSKHAVVGRDALTGEIRWSYTRTDRTACTAAQLGGVTIAVFAQGGNCDELTGLDSGTGARRWTRTLDEDHHPVNGRPQFSVGQDTFLVTTPHVIYAISPDGTQGTDNGGLDRWLFSQDGCTIHGAVLGSAGALISQTCHHPDCNDLKFCGSGPQLLLRDGIEGQDTDSSTNKGNPDQIIWNKIGNTMLPVSADGVVTAARRGGRTLTVLAAKDGRATGTLPLTAPFAGDPESLALANAELIRIGGLTYAVDATGTAYRWHTPTAALPTVTQDDRARSGGIDVTVPSSDGVALLDPSTGKVSHDYPVGAPAGGSRVYRFGSGFVVAGPRTVVYQ